MENVSKLACLLAITLAIINNAESQIQGRIISGTPAAAGQLPWQVVIKRDATDDLLCGGSIISASWVLTAGHCTYGMSSLFLMFGTILLENKQALSMTSSKLFIHPNYNNVNLNNDVSLILLPTPLTFSKTIQPIALVQSTQGNLIGTVATIAGFGLTDDEYLDFSEVLLYARVDVVDNSQCVAAFGTSVVISSTLCAKGDGGSNMSICSGDSGGPLIARDANGNFMQIGINSFVADGSCTDGYPSGYARLTSFLGYISDTTGINFSSS